MKKYLSSHIGRFRLLALLEGTSLLFLIFIAMPLKYMFDIPEGSQFVGPIHGVLFLLFIVYAIVLHFDLNWKFFRTTWKVLVSSFIPFGTFYTDHKILKKYHT